MLGLTGHYTTERQRYSFAGSNFEGVPCSGAASAEYILINFISDCLADHNRIWCSDCTVRKYIRLSLIIYMIWPTFMSLEHKWLYLFYFIPSNCYKDFDKRWWNLQLTVSYIFNATVQHPPQMSWSALSPIYRYHPTTIINKIALTNILMKLHCKNHFPHHHQLIIIYSPLPSSSLASPSPSHHQKRHHQQNRQHHIHNHRRRQRYLQHHHHASHHYLHHFFSCFIPSTSSVKNSSA